VRRSGGGASLARLVMPDAIELAGVAPAPARVSLAPSSHWSDSAPVTRGVSPASERGGDGQDQGVPAVASEKGGMEAGETAPTESGSEQVGEESEVDGAAVEEAESDGPTFVDQLFRVASTRWKKRER
jgi:hypothetical protein